MFEILASVIIMIGATPPDPAVAARHALARQDYRLAGVLQYGLFQPKGVWYSYGLKCEALPDTKPETIYAYGYGVSDAIEVGALDGYAKQKHFLIAYNWALLDSGKLPVSWRCVKDEHPKSVF
ncbi:hypothetical protein [Novosphingobium sp. 9]|uniref:hypothetical protein n=1 Tax=Novosphingobium sp. 9 TaxID=2025349 RepID=UPI0021B5A500|nr:hypothetical protein [Novosphingobium sp. 9]